MNSALWVSKTGLAAQDAKMGAISNNLANVNTDGFKRDRVVFADLFYQNQRTPAHRWIKITPHRAVSSLVVACKLWAPKNSLRSAISK